MESIFNWLYNLLFQNDAAALLSSFGWGVLSVLLSPCHLAAIPLLLGYLAGGRNSDNSAFRASFLFSLGILSTIGVIGIITSSLGSLLGDTGIWVNFVTGIILITAGLYFFELINFKSLNLKNKRLINNSGLTVFILGVSAGLALGPCTFAFMAPVFAYALDSSKTKPVFAFSLFMIYGAGHCAVILAAGMLSAKIQKYLSWAGSSNGIIIFKKVIGVLAIAGGIYIIYRGF